MIPDDDQVLRIKALSAPREVEAATDHQVMVNHRDLVVQFVASRQPWTAHSLHALLQRPVVRFQAAGAIRHRHAEKIEHF